MALPELKVQLQLPNTLLYMKMVMTCIFSLQLQTVMYTHINWLAANDTNEEPMEEGQVHLGFVHSLI